MKTKKGDTWTTPGEGPCLLPSCHWLPFFIRTWEKGKEALSDVLFLKNNNLYQAWAMLQEEEKSNGNQ